MCKRRTYVWNLTMVSIRNKKRDYDDNNILKVCILKFAHGVLGLELWSCN